MSEIKITINVNGESPEVEMDDMEKGKKKTGPKIIKRKTKLGSESILRLPPMEEMSSSQPRGLLDLLGV